MKVRHLTFTGTNKFLKLQCIQGTLKFTILSLNKVKRKWSEYFIKMTHGIYFFKSRGYYCNEHEKM